MEELMAAKSRASCWNVIKPLISKPIIGGIQSANAIPELKIQVEREFGILWEREYKYFNIFPKTNFCLWSIYRSSTDYKIMDNSIGGTWIGPGVEVYEKEMKLSDEIYAKTGRKSIYPKKDMSGIEGFFDDGVPFSFKEPTEQHLKNVVQLINAMPKLVIDNGSNWNIVEGFLKIPFSSFTDDKGVI